jgi:hypothetical protein
MYSGDASDHDGIEGPAGESAPVEGSSAHRHRRRWLIAGVAVALVVGAGGFVTVRWSHGRARPVDLADVVRPTGDDLAPAPEVLRPPQGVYLYRGSGTDALSKPPSTQAEGPSMPGIVRHRKDGCWTFRIDYSTNHWQRWDYCPKAGGLDEVGGAAYQRWNFGAFTNETTSTFDCDAPVVKAGQQPGDEWRQSCTGVSTGVDGETRSSGPFRFVGTETLTIGGRKVAAHHYRRERTNTGNQDGTEHGDVWFAADTGMPLRSEHKIEATTDTIIGEVHYTEDGEFELTSLDRKR